MSIAITGIGLITPAGLTLAENVARLAAGPDSSGSAERFARVAPFALEPRLRYPKNVKFMGRAVQLGMMAALDALDASGMRVMGAPTGRIAVHTACGETGMENEEFFGAYALAWQGRETDFKYLNARAVKMIDPYFSLRTLTNAGSGLIAMELGLNGPSCHFVHGETCGAMALEGACYDLLDDRCDLALCGAYDNLATAATWIAYDGMGLARPKGELVLSEGAAFLVLERTAEARARGARVMGEVVGVDVRAAAGAVGCVPADFEVGRGAYRCVTGYLGAATALAELAMGLERADAGQVGVFRSESWCGFTAAITVKAK
ncbi:MAG: beta-ketoacyl synthase N-terminal-like domain-containing protein [Bryobacteraceae bacterium]